MDFGDQDRILMESLYVVTGYGAKETYQGISE